MNDYLEDKMKENCSHMPGCSKGADRKMEDAGIMTQHQLMGKLLSYRGKNKDMEHAAEKLWDYLVDDLGIDDDNVDKIVECMYKRAERDLC
jgi:hypothetical protein